MWWKYKTIYKVEYVLGNHTKTFIAEEVIRTTSVIKFKAEDGVILEIYRNTVPCAFTKKRILKG